MKNKPATDTFEGEYGKMTDKDKREEFRKRFADNSYEEVGICSGDILLTYWTVDELWSWIQQYRDEAVKEAIILLIKK